MTAPQPDRLDKPGRYYEEEPLRADVVRAAGYVAVAGERVGGQWEAIVYPGDFATGSQIEDNAPLLGSIVTDVEGMSEDPHNNGGPRLAQEEVMPIVASWFGDRGLQAQMDHATPMRGGIYENEAYMGVVFRVAAVE